MSFNVVNNQSESKAACAGKGSLSGFFNRVIRWVDAEAAGPADQIHSHTGNRIDWVRCIPFIALHIACLGVIWVGVSPVAVLMCLAMFVLRMFAITAFYHRYFAHRSFKTSRGWQFFFAALGNTACQRGALWWASHHRKHHKHSDQDADLHSPVRHGFWWSHVGWFMCEDGFKTDYSVIKDWAKFPELRFLNRFDVISPAIFAVLIYGAGEVIAAFWPEAGTSGMQMLVWGFVVSTVLLFHATFTINSLGHIWGSRRFNTQDHSRNNAVLALLTLGEGWHNNHHRFAVSARQGFYWWELDISYLLLKMLSWIGWCEISTLSPREFCKRDVTADGHNAWEEKTIMGTSHNVMREDHSPDNVTKQAEMLVEKFKQLFHQLDASNCHTGLIDDVYRYDIRFEDSFHQIDGVAAFKDYCQSLYQNISFSSFKFHDQWVSRDSAMLTWTMHYAHPKLKWGKGIYVDGATHLRFDDKVYFHKDYFDGGSLLYEHVPVLGTVIQQLKKRLV